MADEVRKLAERTASSTAAISETVAHVRRASEGAVESMHAAAREVEHSVSGMLASGAHLEDITRNSQRVSQLAEHIASTAQQQAAASEDVWSELPSISMAILRLPKVR